MSSWPKTEGMFKDISSDDYHGIRGVYSSSQLKDALKDIEYFYQKYVIEKPNEEKEESAGYFDVGTYFHTEILEPHKLKDECVVFAGTRRGKDWEAFKAHNQGKAIVTRSEMETAQKLSEAVRKSEIAMTRINRGEPEVSAFIRLRVVGSQIYAITWGRVLSKHGWKEANVPKSGIDIWVKVRADLLAEDFILDLKSTTGNAKLEYDMRGKVSSYSYDLSAALYLDIFSAAKQKTMSEFIWTFASKDYFNCKNYKASQDNILIGRAKWKKAVLNIAEGISSNWQFPEYMGILDPNLYEYEFIKEKVEDLL